MILLAAPAVSVQLTGQQAISGSNGQIAFTQGDPNGLAPTNILTANPDGSKQRQVPLGDAVELFSSPIWSPDGTKLLISHTVRLDNTGQCCLPFRPALVNPDGTDYALLSIPDGPFDMDCLVWSHDQDRLLCSFGDQNAGIFSIRASDGGDPVRLTSNPYSASGGSDVPADTSPDGSRFVFLRFKPGAAPASTPIPDAQVALFVESLDGTDLRQITPYLLLEGDRASAKWCPDGLKIISENNHGRLFVVDPDGAGVTPVNLQVGTQRYNAFQPQWSPDSTRIIFNMFINGGEGLFTANPDGSNVIQVTFTTNSAALYNLPNWGTHPVTK